MKKNMGTGDKMLRSIIAIIALLLFFTGKLNGTLGTIALVVAGIFLLTSLISFCPLYSILGINTCKKR